MLNAAILRRPAAFAPCGACSNGASTRCSPASRSRICSMPSRRCTKSPGLFRELTMLSHEELLRYSRHLTLPDVGLEGQTTLGAARVLLIGAGGLGSPAALYLAAAGVGTIGLVDFDVVDASNLQRQIVHGTSSLGRPKTESARERLHDINPHVTI